MKISVVGTGYVGLVTGTCFAEMGNDVLCIDIDQAKVEKMKSGIVPIYEPGLEDIFKKNIQAERLKFSVNLADVAESDVIFLALPTPSDEDGSADLSYILGVADKLGPILEHYTVIVDKSTVPVGTASKVTAAIKQNCKVDFDVVSNPEFLREGQAVADFLKPERVVIGTSSEKAASIMMDLYAPFVMDAKKQIIVTDTPSAEMIKYAANSFLATKISFINQISGLCELVGADIDMVSLGIGSDSRIGNQFLQAGPGYGGSCFPKDVLALQNTAEEAGYELGILEAISGVNKRQKAVIPTKVIKYFGGNLSGKKLAMWGLAFKANTDDIRESPALAIVDGLLEAGASVIAYDPEAADNVKTQYKDKPELTFADNLYDVLQDADALVIGTNWADFTNADLQKVKKLLKKPVIFDGRNIFKPTDMANLGFYYESIGRKTVKGSK
ncbi:UDP-glucose/GDP-mannose dehydrogenase family protein [Candidatus Saccharibacteria bacterium]|nr:UDP-glucose/GDP-mannose dehydrogenase family protein [Candidatus Saccharibacteria bacterium]